jgi:predicted nuclease with RNAse H fold
MAAEAAAKSLMHICGIDYGSKLAGTTVVCAFNDGTGQVHFHALAPKRDADAFLLDYLLQTQPKLIFLDAPLSLPGVYRDLPECQDYFYREADRQLAAMSPMFLGGLTARAMQLEATLRQNGLAVYETYPAAQARRLNLHSEGYKKDPAAIGLVLRQIHKNHPALFSEITGMASWHHVDALLALLAAVRFTRGEHLVYGNEAEGIIVV